MFSDPVAQVVKGRLLVSQDFGAAGAATNCNVVFRSLRDIAAKWLFIKIDNYLDDFWSWEPPWSRHNATFTLHKLFSFLEYDLNPNKHRNGSCLPLLGCAFAATSEGPSMGNKPIRRVGLASELCDLAAARPDHGLASTLIGKMVFAGKGLKGRAGVHARRPL